METIFKLTKIEYALHKKHKYPEFDVSRRERGYFSTLEKAEQTLKTEVEEGCKPDSVFGFLIDEYPFNEKRWLCSEKNSTRTYLPDGSFLDKTLVSSIHDYSTDDSFEEFLGRPADKIRFQKGDLVEVLYHDTVMLEVVMATPLTPEKVHERKEYCMKKFGEYYLRLDSGDDCYRVDNHYRGDNHSHPESVEMFPVRFKVNKKLEERLKKVYLAELLINAVGDGNIELVQTLLKEGADVNSEDYGSGITPMIAAISWTGNKELMVEALLVAGAKVNKKVLKAAEEKGNAVIVEMLKNAKQVS